MGNRQSPATQQKCSRALLHDMVEGLSSPVVGERCMSRVDARISNQSNFPYQQTAAQHVVEAAPCTANERMRRHGKTCSGSSPQRGFRRRSGRRGFGAGDGSRREVGDRSSAGRGGSDCRYGARRRAVRAGSGRHRGRAPARDGAVRRARGYPSSLRRSEVSSASRFGRTCRSQRRSDVPRTGTRSRVSSRSSCTAALRG